MDPILPWKKDEAIELSVVSTSPSPASGARVEEQEEDIRQPFHRMSSQKRRKLWSLAARAGAKCADQSSISIGSGGGDPLAIKLREGGVKDSLVRTQDSGISIDFNTTESASSFTSTTSQRFHHQGLSPLLSGKQQVRHSFETDPQQRYVKHYRRSEGHNVRHRRPSTFYHLQQPFASADATAYERQYQQQLMLRRRVPKGRGDRPSDASGRLTHGSLDTSGLGSSGDWMSTDLSGHQHQLRSFELDTPLATSSMVAGDQFGWPINPVTRSLDVLPSTGGVDDLELRSPRQPMTSLESPPMPVRPSSFALRRRYHTLDVPETELRLATLPSIDQGDRSVPRHRSLTMYSVPPPTHSLIGSSSAALFYPPGQRRSSRLLTPLSPPSLDPNHRLKFYPTPPNGGSSPSPSNILHSFDQQHHRITLGSSSMRLEEIDEQEGNVIDLQNPAPSAPIGGESPLWPSRPTPQEEPATPLHLYNNLVESSASTRKPSTRPTSGDDLERGLEFPPVDDQSAASRQRVDFEHGQSALPGRKRRRLVEWQPTFGPFDDQPSSSYSSNATEFVDRSFRFDDEDGRETHLDLVKRREERRKRKRADRLSSRGPSTSLDLPSIPPSTPSTVVAQRTYSAGSGGASSRDRPLVKPDYYYYLNYPRPEEGDELSPMTMKKSNGSSPPAADRQRRSIPSEDDQRSRRSVGELKSSVRSGDAVDSRRGPTIVRRKIVQVDVEDQPTTSPSQARPFEGDDAPPDNAVVRPDGRLSTCIRPESVNRLQATASTCPPSTPPDRPLISILKTASSAGKSSSLDTEPLVDTAVDPSMPTLVQPHAPSSTSFEDKLRTVPVKSEVVTMPPSLQPTTIQPPPQPPQQSQQDFIDYWDHSMFALARIGSVILAGVASVCLVASIGSNQWVYQGLGGVNATYSGFWKTCNQLNRTCHFTLPFVGKKNGWQDGALCTLVLALLLGLLGLWLSFAGHFVYALNKRLYYFHSSGEAHVVAGTITMLGCIIFIITAKVHLVANAPPNNSSLPSSQGQVSLGAGHGLGWATVGLYFLSALLLFLDEIVRKMAVLSSRHRFIRLTWNCCVALNSCLGAAWNWLASLIGRCRRRRRRRHYQDDRLQGRHRSRLKFWYRREF